MKTRHSFRLVAYLRGDSRANRRSREQTERAEGERFTGKEKVVAVAAALSRRPWGLR